MLGWNGKEYDWDKLFQFEMLKEILASLGNAHLLWKDEVDKWKESLLIKDNKMNEWERMFNDKMEGNSHIGVYPESGKEKSKTKEIIGDDDDLNGDYGDFKEENEGNNAGDADEADKNKGDAVKDDKDDIIRRTEEDKEFDKIFERNLKITEQDVNIDQDNSEQNNGEKDIRRRTEENNKSDWNESQKKEIKTNENQSDNTDNKQPDMNSDNDNKNNANDHGSGNTNTNENIIKTSSNINTDPNNKSLNTQSNKTPNQTLTKLQRETNSKLASTNEMITALFKKVKQNQKQLEDLEQKIKNPDSINNLLNGWRAKLLKEIAKSNTTSQNWFNTLNASFSDFLAKNAETDKLLDEVRFKLHEFSVYDLVQSSSDGGNIDLSKAWIMNLETKVFKKFAMTDERIKSDSNEVWKLKNECTNNKANTDHLAHQIRAITEQIEAFKKSYNDFSDKQTQTTSDLRKDVDLYNKNMNKSLDDLKSALEKQWKGQRDELKNDIKELENQKSSPSSMDWLNMNMINPDVHAIFEKKVKEWNKRINDVEANFKQFANTIPLEEWKSGINELKFAMQEKIAHSDWKELYDWHIMDHEELSDVKDTNHILSQEQKRIQNDVLSFTQKLEWLNSSLNALKNANREASTDINPIDISKFIDQSKFLESTRAWNAELDRLRKEDESQQRMLDDIYEKLDSFADISKVNKVEGNILNWLNEYKVVINKKYADKAETNKVIKTIETQLRILGDDSKKKENEGESWLLAKKPINGYQCASCEANIQNLNPTKEYLPWNKYPQREEKAYRMGSGFSHMLQMISSGIAKNSDEKNFSSDNEDLTLQGNQPPRSYSGIKRIKPKTGKIKLPRVGNKKRPRELIGGDVHYSDDEKHSRWFNSSENILETPSGEQPKITKITKINKLNSASININASAGNIRRGLGVNVSTYVNNNNNSVGGNLLVKELNSKNE